MLNRTSSAFYIYECTGYYDKNRPTWQQMEKLAINIATGPLKPVGFKVGIGFHEATTIHAPVSTSTKTRTDEEED